MHAIHVSRRLRPDAVTSPDWLFCHVYDRGRNADQYIPGWPYSSAATLEPGRTSWTAIPDAVRPGARRRPCRGHSVQVRTVAQRLVQAGQRHTGDPDVLVVFDSATTSA